MDLPLELYALIRFGHVASAVVWLGLIYFMAFVRPRMFSGLSDETRRQVMPHLAQTITPVMIVASTLTIFFGILLHLDLGGRIGFANIGMGLNLAILLAFIMYLIGLIVILPIARRTARVLQGGTPPTADEIRRMGTANHVMAGLGIIVLFVMVGSQRIPGL